MHQTSNPFDERLARIEQALGLEEPQPESTEERVARLESSNRRLRLALAATIIGLLAAAAAAGLALARHSGQQPVGLSSKQQLAEARLVLRSVNTLKTLQKTLNRVGATVAVDSLIGNQIKPASLTTTRGKTCLKWILKGKGTATTCGFK